MCFETKHLQTVEDELGNLAVTIWSLSFPTPAYSNGVRPPAAPPPVLRSTLIMVYVKRILTNVGKVLAKVQTVQIC